MAVILLSFTSRILEILIYIWWTSRTFTALCSTISDQNVLNSSYATYGWSHEKLNWPLCLVLLFSPLTCPRLPTKSSTARLSKCSLWSWHVILLANTELIKMHPRLPPTWILNSKKFQNDQNVYTMHKFLYDKCALFCARTMLLNNLSFRHPRKMSSVTETFDHSPNTNIDDAEYFFAHQYLILIVWPHFKCALSWEKRCLNFRFCANSEMKIILFRFSKSILCVVLRTWLLTSWQKSDDCKNTIKFSTLFNAYSFKEHCCKQVSVIEVSEGINLQ